MSASIEDQEMRDVDVSEGGIPDSRIMKSPEGQISGLGQRDASNLLPVHGDNPEQALSPEPKLGRQDSSGSETAESESESESSGTRLGRNALLTSSRGYKPSSATTPFSTSVGYDRDDILSEEIAEGVWGYLIPLNHVDANYGSSFVLRDRDSEIVRAPEEPAMKHKEPLAPTTSRIIAAGYSIGRHSECGK